MRLKRQTAQVMGSIAIRRSFYEDCYPAKSIGRIVLRKAKMGVYYFLTCMKCKTGLYLGKAIRTKYEVTSKSTFGFDILDHSTANVSESFVRNAEMLGHFLMLHRTHELRVLPDTVEKFVTDIGFPQSSPDMDDQGPHNRLAFLETSVGKPDPEREANELSAEVIKVLKTF